MTFLSLDEWFEQCLNQLQLNLISLFVNLFIWSGVNLYYFLEARRMIVINLSFELYIIMTRYDFLEAWGVILIIVRTDSKLT